MQMKYVLVCLTMLVALSQANAAGNKIKVYFNNPVDLSFSSGTPAIYANRGLDDTLVSYINRAKYSLDIAVFEYETSSSIANIATAINNAYTRGVRVRIIKDGTTSIANTGFAAVNSGVKQVASPQGANYTIMHNKYVVIDQRSKNASEPTIWTGSTNWTPGMFNTNENNVVIIQDSSLADAYTTEFNEMWGDTGLIPNSVNAKFGQYKTNNTQHNFMIDGHAVELYFSPSDGTNSQILNAINSADSELYFGVYTFTNNTDATAIASKIAAGKTVKGIMDDFSKTYTPYATLSPVSVMGANLKIPPSNAVYHNKMMVVDPQYPSSDPLVLTGSHNWSKAADTQNDENTLIIHDATIANMYLQSFAQNFKDLGGNISPLVTGIAEEDATNADIQVYPNPAHDRLYLESKSTAITKATLYSVDGRNTDMTLDAASSVISLSQLATGMYLLKVETSIGVSIHKIFVY
jgi:phosphatidylserine/phosphatidylglycerophosphate/cardiolipin synthase-like enzyme